MNVTYPSLSLVFVAIGILLLWWIPIRQARELGDDARLKQFDAENEARRTLAQVLGGLLVLVSLYFTAKALAVSQEGQLTDRFVKSLDLLGKQDSPEARLGGVYSLERIARDSERDHAPIMSILATSARQASTQAIPGEASPHLEAILTVITRRNLEHEKHQDRQIDLRRVAAPGAFLMYGNFVRLNLFQVSFPRADLRFANFNQCYGEGANLRSANLTHVRLDAGTNFKSADFTEADLSGASSLDAYFENAIFKNAILKGAIIKHSNFQNADLSSAILDDTDLEYSYFKGADLRGRDLRRTNLDGANIAGAKLEGVQVRAAQLRRLFVDESGKLEIRVSEQ
jgi:uncharacterized protein YjbI with pentapeptide repeats